MGNSSLGVNDYCWGDNGPLKIGIWAAGSYVGQRESVNLRGAVLNTSDQRLELKSDFLLAVKHGEEVIEQIGGPRWSEPISLEPGEFKEVLGWSLEEETGLKQGLNNCWIIYQCAGEELHSAVVEIEVR